MATQIAVSSRSRVASVDAATRNAMIADAAYYRAERRRFEGGHELEDWLAAEVEIDRLLRGEEPPPSRRGASVRRGNGHA